MKIFYSILFCLAILSCQKEMSEERDLPTIPPIITDTIKPPNVTDTTVSTTNLSKLKRIVESWGNKKTIVNTLEYDASNRLIKFNQWQEDSTLTQSIITWSHNSEFLYIGNSEYPHKNIITDKNGSIDSMIYLYDLDNRIVKEDYFRKGINVLRYSYDYISQSNIKITQSETGTGYNFKVITTFNSHFDNSGKVVEEIIYDSENKAYAEINYEYDTKVNPLSTINVFKHINCIRGNGMGFTFRAKNNITKIIQVYDTPNSNSTITYNYIYNINGTPALGSYSETETNSANNRYASVIYEYY